MTKRGPACACRTSAGEAVVLEREFRSVDAKVRSRRSPTGAIEEVTACFRRLETPLKEKVDGNEVLDCRIRRLSFVVPETAAARFLR
jgi:hypothetical protein